MNAATTRRRTPAQWVQDTLQRAYERRGPRGLVVLGYASVSTATALIAFGLIIVGSRYARLELAEAIPWAATGGLIAAAVIWLGMPLTRESLNTMLGWSGEGRALERAPEVWNTTVRYPRLVTVRTVLVLYALLAIVGQPVGIASWDVSWSSYLPTMVLWAAILATAAVAVMLYLEMLVKPLLADVAAFLPDDFAPSASTMQLRSKAILPVPGVVIFTGAIMAAVIDTGAGYTMIMLQAIAVTAAISLVAVAIYYVLAHAFLDPLDDLIEATHRVGAGELGTRVPVVSSDELGTLAVGFNQMMIGLQDRERLRSHNAELTAQLRSSLEEVRASRARIVAAADEERRRMERDLHDGAQQRLVMISLKLAMAADLLTKDPTAAAALHDELRADAARAVDELRDLAHGIYPPLLESDGLASALEDIADQSPLPVAVRSEGAGRYPAPVEAAVYFCCLEALQNAAKYAGPDCHATIRLGEANGVLHFAIADDGRGFDTSGVNGTAGLQNMADRMGALGGSLSIRSVPGSGTTVEGSVPV